MDDDLKLHIGVVLIDESLGAESCKDWIKFACGTGTLINENTVITAAHLIKPAIQK
jgi:hypothetical protein